MAGVEVTIDDPLLDPAEVPAVAQRAVDDLLNLQPRGMSDAGTFVDIHGTTVGHWSVTQP